MDNSAIKVIDYEAVLARYSSFVEEGRLVKPFFNSSPLIPFVKDCAKARATFANCRIFDLNKEEFDFISSFAIYYGISYLNGNFKSCELRAKLYCGCFPLSEVRFSAEDFQKEWVDREGVVLKLSSNINFQDFKKIIGILYPDCPYFDKYSHEYYEVCCSRYSCFFVISDSLFDAAGLLSERRFCQALRNGFANLRAAELSSVLGVPRDRDFKGLDYASHCLNFVLSKSFPEFNWPPNKFYPHVQGRAFEFMNDASFQESDLIFEINRFFRMKDEYIYYEVLEDRAEAIVCSSPWVKENLSVSDADVLVRVLTKYIGSCYDGSECYEFHRSGSAIYVSAVRELFCL